MTGSLRGKTVFITGASRGIGKAIGLRCARDGANVVVAAKTVEPHPRLEGTIHTAVAELIAAGGQALACEMDVRFEDQVAAAVEQAISRFGTIDVVVNNASAIDLSGTLEVSMKRYDLMHSVNVRGAFLTAKTCLPHLRTADNPHILNISPPLDLAPQWFAPHLAYTMSKFGMSLCVLGMAEEFRTAGVAVNALWPRTTIATAAIRNLLGGDEAMRLSRTPDIMADAAFAIVTQPSREFTGHFFIDEQVLRDHGVTDFDRYLIEPGATPRMDLFVRPS